MNRLLAGALALVLVSGSVLPAFAELPPPTIKFKGLEKGCKVFEITDMDGFKKGGVSRVDVDNFAEDIQKPKVNPEEDGYTKSNHLHQFHFIPSEEKVTLTVCPKAGEKSISFKIVAYDAQPSPNPRNVEVKEGMLVCLLCDATFHTLFDNVKKIGKKDCEKQAKSRSQSDNLKDLKFQCNDNFIFVSGNLIDPKKPGTLAFIIDPPAEIFLFVLELCVTTDEELFCPVDVPMDLPLSLDDVVGGEIIPIDSTSLLLAGAQTPIAWMMYAFSAIGIGAFLFTRNQNNVRNVKVILQDYLDKFGKTD